MTVCLVRPLSAYEIHLAEQSLRFMDARELYTQLCNFALFVDNSINLQLEFWYYYLEWS